MPESCQYYHLLSAVEKEMQTVLIPTCELGWKQKLQLYKKSKGLFDTSEGILNITVLTKTGKLFWNKSQEQKYKPTKSLV